MADGLGQLQRGLPLAVVGADLVRGRSHPARHRVKQAKLRGGIGGPDQLPPATAARAGGRRQRRPASPWRAGGSWPATGPRWSPAVRAGVGLKAGFGAGLAGGRLSGVGWRAGAVGCHRWKRLSSGWVAQPDRPTSSRSSTASRLAGARRPIRPAVPPAWPTMPLVSRVLAH
jgi:hypothetical protein